MGAKEKAHTPCGRRAGPPRRELRFARRTSGGECRHATAKRATVSSWLSLRSATAALSLRLHRGPPFGAGAGGQRGHSVIGRDRRRRCSSDHAKGGRLGVLAELRASRSASLRSSFAQAPSSNRVHQIRASPRRRPIQRLITTVRAGDRESAAVAMDAVADPDSRRGPVSNAGSVTMCVPSRLEPPAAPERRHYAGGAVGAGRWRRRGRARIPSAARDSVARRAPAPHAERASCRDPRRTAREESRAWTTEGM